MSQEMATMVVGRLDDGTVSAGAAGIDGVYGIGYNCHSRFADRINEVNNTVFRQQRGCCPGHG